ncbi:MarR family winged helix-turn-helix transcriptional regulator [Pseudomonas fluorescens]|nr:MarR family winged helix-turn-helix transcriptional regulator [Pseudomonas fluorescens]
MAAEEKRCTRTKAHDDAVAPFVSLFYSIHYQFGMKLERRMCHTRLSRQQAAVIWVIQSETDEDGWVRRRSIELALNSWFDCCNSRVSRLIKELGSPPLQLIIQRDSPTSKREKVVALTEAGKSFLFGMQRAGEAFFLNYFSHMNREEMLWGQRFLSKAFAAHRPNGKNSNPLPLPPARIDTLTCASNPSSN